MSSEVRCSSSAAGDAAAACASPVPLSAATARLPKSAPALFMGCYGPGPRGCALVFALVGAAAAVGSLLNARLARRLALERTIALGLGLAAKLANLASYLPGLYGPHATVPGFALFCLSFGLIAANAGALALQLHGAIADSAAGVLGVLQTVLPGCFAGLVAVLADGAPSGLPAGMPLVLVASAVVLARVSTRRS